MAKAEPNTGFVDSQSLMITVTLLTSRVTEFKDFSKSSSPSILP